LISPIITEDRPGRCNRLDDEAAWVEVKRRSERLEIVIDGIASTNTVWKIDLI
jgi:hypothetical protein